MSGQDDALREMAANRGCRLVKSRRRKQGGDFGRYGLKDRESGREMFGFGARGLTATAEEIQAYLRSGGAASWKRSLIAPVDKHPPPRAKRAAPRPGRKAEPAQPKRAEARKAKPEKKHEKKPEPRPPKPPKVRESRPGDAEAVAGLLIELGYDVTAPDVRRRMQALRKGGEPLLVAERDDVVGCVTWHVTPVVHRPRPVGRITMLVVAEAERGAGIGALLVEAVEARLRRRGCGLLEVTSNMKRMRAHVFYEGLGFERTSYRFGKMLDE